MGFIYSEMKCRSVMIPVYALFIYRTESALPEKTSTLLIIIYSDIKPTKTHLALGIKTVIYSYNSN